jgi:uncharacterized membrane protein
MFVRTRITLLAALATSLAYPALTQAAGLKYRVTNVRPVPLPKLDGSGGIAHDINNAQQVVGFSYTAANLRNAVLFLPNGTIQNISPLIPGASSEALGINSNGEVVGKFSTAANAQRPFYWHTSTGVVVMSKNLFPLILFGAAYSMEANAINDQGMIVGEATYNGPGSPGACKVNAPVYWTNSNALPARVTCVGAEGQRKPATDISNSGYITHFTWNQQQAYRHAYPLNLNVSAPNAAGQTVGGVELYGVNESGAVAGAFGLKQPNTIWAHAYYWNGTAAAGTDLGFLPSGNSSFAYDVNEQSFVAGGASEGPPDMFGDLTPRAFLWHKDFGLYKLPIPWFWPAADQCTALALNDLRIDTQNVKHLEVAGYCIHNAAYVAMKWAVLIAEDPA